MVRREEQDVVVRPVDQVEADRNVVDLGAVQVVGQGCLDEVVGGRVVVDDRDFQAGRVS